MDSYEIIMTPDAVTDLVELRNYIADVLLVPDTALSYIRAIRSEISNLTHMTGRIRIVEEEPYHSLGIRKLSAKKFFVYFRIDEDMKRVYILNVISSRRDQLRQLSKMKID